MSDTVEHITSFRTGYLAQLEPRPEAAVSRSIGRSSNGSRCRAFHRGAERRVAVERAIPEERITM
ncbi:hypothetical protein [Nocardia sp. NBC_01388]|uniref:hypothetical protein n=1 Tax=Nocardia sp. NBC_01388 TaxID=2903596 RepID=UPI0032516CD8